MCELPVVAVLHQPLELGLLEVFHHVEALSEIEQVFELDEHFRHAPFIVLPVAAILVLLQERCVYFVHLLLNFWVFLLYSRALQQPHQIEEHALVNGDDAHLSFNLVDALNIDVSKRVLAHDLIYLRPDAEDV